MGMSRRQIREVIFKLLFSTEFYSREDLQDQLALSLADLDRIIAADSAEDALDSDETGRNVPDSDEKDSNAAFGEDIPEAKISDADAAYIREKLQDICLHLDDIDAAINAGTEGWKTTRMAKAELAIIRLAVYEMKYEEDMPVSVAINEAVELAKIYGSDKGSSFVNGVLAKLA